MHIDYAHITCSPYFNDRAYSVSCVDKTFKYSRLKTVLKFTIDCQNSPPIRINLYTAPLSFNVLMHCGSLIKIKTPLIEDGSVSLSCYFISALYRAVYVWLFHRARSLASV